MDGTGERQRAALFEHMITGFAYHRVVTDDDGRPIDYVFLEINPAFERLTGLRAADLIGRRVTEALPGIENDPADWIGTYGRVALGGDAVRFEQYSEALDRWYNVCAYSPEPGHFAVTFDEITALKQAQQEHDRLIRDLEQKNAELERFTYTASHQLRSPLVTVRGFLDALQEDLAAGDLDSVGDDIDRIRRAADRMNALLDQLLELSRVGRIAGDSAVSPVAELVDVVREALAGILERVTFEVDVPGSVTVCGDRGRLLEVLQNLLENAAKFSASAPDATVRVEAAGDARRTTIRVIDNGVGIPPEYQQRIFRLFERLDTAVPGTGIGLALTKRIVEHHGGTIAVHSAGTGHGATFEVELPASEPAVTE